MYKKLIFVLFLSFLIFSCGKKSDPVFKESKKEKQIGIIFDYKV